MPHSPSNDVTAMPSTALVTAEAPGWWAPESALTFHHVPMMVEVEEENKPRALEQFHLFENELNEQPTDTLLGAIMETRAHLPHHCSHMVARFCRKWKVTRGIWNQILQRCNLPLNVAQDDDGVINLMTLSPENLRRLYEDAPVHHMSILGAKPPRPAAAGPKSTISKKNKPGRGRASASSSSTPSRVPSPRPTERDPDQCVPAQSPVVVSTTSNGKKKKGMVGGF